MTYDEKCGIAARCRDRAYQLTRNFVLGAFAITGFLATNADMALDTTHRAAGGAAVLIVTALCLFLLHQSYRVLYAILQIVANLERAAGFHTPGIYLDGPLYPVEAGSPERLEQGDYDRPTEYWYKTVVGIAGLLVSMSFAIL
ncbi:hypothetical protein [Palleronia pelagia]|nr:hypothetical protein [Palleronia pelagia]